MRSRILMIVGLLGLVVLAGCSTQPETRTVDAEEFASLAADPAVFVLDVHTPEQVHVPGTDGFIAHDALRENARLLPTDKDTPIALYCRSGSMSQEAVATLQDMGYTRIYELGGGMNAWQAAGKPVDDTSWGEHKSFTRSVELYKSPSCGCCGGYAQRLGSEDFTVETHDLMSLVSIKSEHGIPSELQSCHTSIIDGYVVEGHVPMEAVERLLEERPDIRGIALPGMPSGTPGMPGPKTEDYVIYALTDDGYEEWMRL